MKEKNWGIHLEFVVIFVTLVGGFYTLDAKIERQGARTDKLYEMFYTSLEDNNKKWNELRVEMDKKWTETDRKFYDLLKEKR
jgi:hypothetical protein